MTSTPLLRKEALMIDSRVAILNNSAFGCLTSSLQAAREGYVEEIEKDPYSYHKFHMPAQMLQVNHKLKDYLGVEEHDILHLTSNTSAGIFAALRSILPLQPGDVVMISSFCYHSIRDAVHHMCQHVRVIEIDIPFPVLSKDDIVEAFKKAVEDTKGNKVRLAVVEHISSKPSVLFPLEDILPIFEAAQIPVLVDGAHAVGQATFYGDDLKPTDTRLSHMRGATFYAGNFYKHCYGPRAAGFLFIRMDSVRKYALSGDHFKASKGELLNHRKKTTSEDSKPAYLIDTLVQGVYDESTRDYSQYLVLDDCIAFRKEITSMDNFPTYLDELTVWTTRYLCETWMTEELVCADCQSYMVNAELPKSAVAAARYILANGDESLVIQEIQRWLLEEHLISAVLYSWNKRILTRVSIEAFTTKDDITRLAKAVMQLTEQVSSSEKL